MAKLNRALEVLVDEGVGPLLGQSALYASKRLQHWVNRLAYSNSSYGHQIMAGLVDRPYYAYCIHEAAKLGEILGYGAVSVLEFGVGDGTGLENIEMHVEEIEDLFDVEVEIYGFDTGEGPPPPEGYKDMPYAYNYEWARSAYKEYAISEWPSRAELVLGEIRETRTSFFEEYDPAPIGCAFFDMNIYSSTKDALRVFDTLPENYLPRVLCQFDTVVADEVTRAFNNDYVGENAAIHEFNDDHNDRKIAKVKYRAPWNVGPIEPNEMYQFHSFEHPRYDAPIRSSSDDPFENIHPGTRQP